MLHKHHAVRISTGGYKLVASFDSAEKAMSFVTNQSVSSFGIVYRDGLTGKRYSQSECLEIINAPYYRPCTYKTVRLYMKRYFRLARIRHKSG